MLVCFALSHPREALTKLFISHLLLVEILRATADTPLKAIKFNCTGGAYTINSQFAYNLAALLSFLTGNSYLSNSATANITGGSRSDAAYGLFMCQGDIADSDCYSCVNTAAMDITNSCPAARQAVIWYNSCELRYSDFDFASIPDMAGFNMSNTNEKTTSSKPFAMVADLVKSAPSQPLMFASKALTNESLYALAQCTAGLSPDGCSKCLTTILGDIQNCCTQWKGWRYLATSCWIRYEPTSFLEDVNAYTETSSKNCSTSTFPSNNLAIMESNFDDLLSNLTLKAQPTGFCNITSGRDSDQLYGLALCRVDLIASGADCDMCLENAGKTITRDCPNSIQGVIWYEKCLVRYSNQNFFGAVDLAGEVYCGVQPVSQAESDATFKLAVDLVETTASNPLMAAAGAGDPSSSYVLLQCTRDLSAEGCKQCLETGLTTVEPQCKLTNGWRYLSGSCTLRYEVFPFFDTSAISSPAFQPALAPQEKAISSPAFQPALAPQEKDEIKKKMSAANAAAIVAPIIGMVLLGLLLYYRWWKPRSKNGKRRDQFNDISPLPDAELPLMDLAIIQAATNNFSDENKLGQGGFGPVYKGLIHGEQEIAVKRLSRTSKQGTTEFKNEVKLIAKLQHRNLVRMLGCCIERDEKLLIYEFLPNKSLDVFLFDPDKRTRLDWKKRAHIIGGIARGLLYLHEDSRLKVIHRDLKASNVLLDNKMNPKISDFGMAKIFEVEESGANEANNTNRIVGTYGYMAPEYAMDGLYSVKSDVYSFGVLLLEIISGEKNGRSHYERYGQSLLKHAWQLWNEDKGMELMDPLLECTYSTNEASKHMYIGLLCVQENSEQRPTMSLVVHMLRANEMVYTPPTQPPTFIRHQRSLTDLSSNNHSTINEMSETIIVPR